MLVDRNQNLGSDELSLLKERVVNRMNMFGVESINLRYFYDICFRYRLYDILESVVGNIELERKIAEVPLPLLVYYNLILEEN